MDQKTITFEQLKSAFARWEQMDRDGQTMPREEAKQMPLDEFAQASAEHLWGLLFPA